MKKSGRLSLFVVLIFSLFLPPALVAGAGGTVQPAQESGPAAAGPVPLEAWWAQARANLERSEYRLSWQEETYLADVAAAWQAPNRAQNLRPYFTPTGLHLIPRQEGAHLSWRVDLALAGRGSAGAEQPLPPAVLEPAGNSLLYHRGLVQERYTNEPDGLLQEVLLEQVAGDEETLLLSLDLSAGMSLRLADGGQSLELLLEGRPVLRYGGLTALDGAGRPLPARFQEEPPAIVLNTTGGLPPVRLGAVLTGPGPTGLPSSPDWSEESDQAGARMGYAVGTAGDVNGDGYSDIVVGADRYDNGNTDEGAVLVYYGSTGGPGASPDWTAEGGQDNAYLGGAAITAGDVNDDGYADLIVGAMGYSNGQSGEGQVQVYHGSATGLSSTPDWSVESEQDGASLGRSVCPAGDVNGDGYSDVIVGAHFYDNGQADEGRAFVYHGSATGLSTTAAWTAEADQADARMGVSACTAGDVNGDGYADVIVGARNYDNGQADEGRAFVYHGSASGLSSTADWTAEADQASAALGYSVGPAGDVNGDGYADAIVGAYFYDNGQSNEGMAFVYHGSASGLSSTADWTAEADQATARMGASVFAAGDVNGDGYADVVVGADRYDNGQLDEGMAWVYKGSSSGLGSSAYWSADGGQASAYYGAAVGTAGDVNGDGYADLIVGAYNYTNGQSGEGAAYLYVGAADGLRGAANWNNEGNQDSAEYGWAVASAGDVNGDGYADIAVGAPYYDNGQSNEGTVFVYYGSATGPSTTADWTGEGEQTFAYYGYAVASAGDVNGDGYEDLIVGAYWYDNGETDEGRAFVYHGSSTGLSTTANWTAESNQADADFGWSVGTVGDLNDDGCSDVIVGAHLYDNGQADEGMAFVYHGSATGLSPTADWTTEGNQVNARWGHQVGTAGDVNRDGYSDAIISASWYDNGETDEGRAFVYHGSGSGLSTTPDWTGESDQANAYYGWAAGTAGDVNGDGYADVIIGAHYYDNGQTSEGRVFVYHGSGSGLSTTPDWTVEANLDNAYMGAAAGTAGDVNGDGYADVIVGAYGYANGQSREGRAFVYLGSSSGLGSTADWTAESNQANAEFGRAVASAGDVNGDGYAEVIVGAHNYDNGLPNEGRAWLYYGNQGVGMTLNPRQRLSDDSGPIARLGWSDQTDTFRLNLLGRTPYGRGGVLLEWEVKQLGTLFDGTGTGQGSAWADTGTTGVQLSESATGLTAATAYHWRVRLRYDPVTTPFQPYSRWLTMPWNGWEEEDLRTSAPSEVVLLYFVARPAPGGVELLWETASERDNLGFNLYRSTQFDQLDEPLNQALIPSRSPGGGSGAVYAFLDDTVLPGGPYFYTLEDVDAQNGRTPHGPIRFTLWRVYLPLVSK